MQRCGFCGAELPINARFCGNCGHMLADRGMTVTDITNPPTTSIPESHTPPLFSSPLYPNVQDTEMRWQDSNATLRTNWSHADMESANTQFNDRKSDEHDVVLPDFLVPGILAAQSQMPSPTQAPMVQGTPQFGGVPSVQGTPMAPGNVPQSVPGPAQGAGEPAHPYAPQEPQSIPLHNQPVQQPMYQPPPPHYQPVHHPQPTLPPHELEHHHQRHHHHTSPLRTHRPHTSRLHHPAAVTSKVGKKGSRWLIVAIAAVVVIATSGVIVFLANSPGLSLSGNSTVAAGQVLHLHGKGFLPGGSVSLSIDNGSPVTFIPHEAQGNVNAADSSSMQLAGLSERQIASDTSASIDSLGTFDADVTVPSTWPQGVHTLHAMESFGSRRADLQFTVIPTAAKLTATPLNLHFSELQQGSRALLAVMVGNAGGRSLTWTADTLGTPWLKALSVTGRIFPGSLSQAVYVAADATHLKVGDYTAILRISSNAGEARVGVTLKVISPIPKKQARLDVNPTSLDFGSQSVGKQVTQAIAISNLGTQTLHWQANTVNASWLTLANITGTILPGQIPQTIYVTADTTKLKAGNYSATLNLTSDGGSAGVIVTLAVVNSPPTPTPTAVPTNVPPPNLVASPRSFNGNTDCSYTQGQGWMCVESLSSGPNAQSNLNWTASSSGIQGIAFFPAKGTLTPGQPSQVNIVVPDTSCPANATFTFAGVGNTASIPWSCNPPPPTLTVIPSYFNANTDCTNTQGQGWSCVATLDNQSSKSSLAWSANATGIAGVLFTPANGTLSVNQSQSVTIVIPNTTCPASATFTFTGPNNVVNVPWSCPAPIPPKLVVNPSNLNFDTLNAGDSAILPVQVSNTGGQPLTWNADTGGTSWLSLDISADTIPAASPPLTVHVTADTSGLVPGKYTASVNFTSNGGNAKVAVSLVVTPQTQLPVLMISPTNLMPSVCPWYSEAFLCKVTLTESSNSQGNLNWTASTTGSASIEPSSGTLTPGQSMQVSIFAGCDSETITFVGPGNAVSATWSCPTVTVSPTALNSTSSSCLFDSTSNTYTCTVALTETTDSLENANWITDSGGDSVQFSPASGTLSPGQTTKVQITNIPCQNGTFAFYSPYNKGGDYLPVSWTCTPTQTPPVLTVSASGYCPADSSGNYICTDTLTITGSQGSIDWSVSAESDLPGTTFNPPNGTLSAGQSPQTVTVTIPGSDCPTYSGGHYDYTWTGSHTARVTFTCLSSTPTPTPQPTPTSQPTPTPSPTSQPTPTPEPTPTSTPQLGLLLLGIPSMILIAWMTRFYEYRGRAKRRKRK